MADESLFVRIRASGKEAISEFNKTAAAADESGKKTTSAWSKAGQGIKLAGLAIAGVAVAIAGKSIEMADQYETAHARMIVALKNTGTSWDAQKKAIDAVSESATAFGTKTDVENALAVMTTGMGSASKAMANFQLVEDLTAKTGKPLADVALAVTKASEGQLRPLKQLGIDLPVAAGGALKAQNAYIAWGKAQDALKTVQEKIHDGLISGASAMFALQTATENVTAAHDKFNTTANTGQTILTGLAAVAKGSAKEYEGTLGGSVKSLKNEFGNLEINLGQQLTPVLKDVTNFVKNDAVPWVKTHGTVVRDLAIGVGVLGAAFVTFKGIMLAVKVAQTAVTVAQTLAAAAQWAWNAALTANPIGLVIVAIAALAAGVVYAYKHVGWFKGVINDVWGVMKAVGSWIAGTWSSIWSGMSSVVSGAVGTVAHIWNDTMGALFHGEHFGVGPFSVTLPDLRIPGYALGGTVPGPIGAPQLAIVHGGETVTPISGSPRGGNGNGTTIVIHNHFTGTTIGSSDEFKRQLMTALRQIGGTKDMSSNYGQQVKFT